MNKLLFPALTNKLSTKLTSIVVTVCLISACQHSDKPHDFADIIIENGKIYTVDKSHPWATAIAIKNGKIVALGNSDEMQDWVTDKTQTIDASGRLILPSFGDAHVHPVYGGLAYARCSMHAIEDAKGYEDIIRKCVKDTPEERWVYGVGWRPGFFPPDGIPPKGLLDEISSDRPLVFRSTGGHSLWLNSKALELAGITQDTPDPLNGRIDRDPVSGELLGGLQESAMDLVAQFIPEPTQTDLENAISYTINHLNKEGITNILDAGVDVEQFGKSKTIEAYKSLEKQNKLTAYAEVAVKWENEIDLQQSPSLFAAAESVQSEKLSSNTLKIWIDGVIAQRTAAMLAPYSDSRSELGEPTQSETRLNNIVAQFDKAGYQVMIHAIGDRGIRMSLDAFEYARKQNGSKQLRHQITHAEFITLNDISRFAELGVTANFQPLWSTMDPYMKLTAVRVGLERMKKVYPANSVINAGAEIVYGSDWPVASANPLLGIEVALTRRTPGDPSASPLLPEEAVTLEQAIEAYTINVAKINGNESKTGSLMIGKNADLVILDQDIFSIGKYKIAETKILVTLFNGKPVYGSLENL